jgi:hypothetical protein
MLPFSPLSRLSLLPPSRSELTSLCDGGFDSADSAASALRSWARGQGICLIVGGTKKRKASGDGAPADLRTMLSLK